MMAKYWLPVQGFDEEDLADSGLGEAGASNAGEIEKRATELLPSAPNGGITTATPQKRRAATAQNPSPRKKKPVVVAKGVVVSSSGGEPAMAEDKGEEDLSNSSRPDPNVTTAICYYQKGHAPPDAATTHESGIMTKEEEDEGTATNIIKPGPDQSAAIAIAIGIPTTGTTTTANPINPNPKNQKKPPPKNKKAGANPKSSPVDSTTENIISTSSITPISKNNNKNKNRDKTKKAKVNSLPMPISWQEAGVADRMLVSMRDNGEDWAKIRKEWKEVTGSDTAASTLPTRYSRLKASMTVLEDGDAARLIQAKDQVELRLETEKYAMIADTLEQLGGKRYPNVVIRKEVKKLEKE